MNADDECIQHVADALQVAGVHRSVALVVNQVVIDGLDVRIDLTLRYLRAHPVCCDEPGCYVPFLGRNRSQLPAILQTKLDLILRPRVTMTVHLVHEADYEHVVISTGERVGPGRDQSQPYVAADFS